MESKTNKPKTQTEFIDTENRLVVARGGVAWMGGAKMTNSSCEVSESRASGTQYGGIIANDTGLHVWRSLTEPVVKVLTKRESFW